MSQTTLQKVLKAVVLQEKDRAKNFSDFWSVRIRCSYNFVREKQELFPELGVKPQLEEYGIGKVEPENAGPVQVKFMDFAQLYLSARVGRVKSY